jgi:hypothetical protein
MADDTYLSMLNEKFSLGQRSKLYVVRHMKLIVKGGDSWGISVTGETPQVARATEEAHRTPPRKASAFNGNQRADPHTLELP